jgi:ABC-type uncharacterized transport system ATPase subunit
VISHTTWTSPGLHIANKATVLHQGKLPAGRQMDDVQKKNDNKVIEVYLG